jgi:hypothetical protein
VSKQHRSGLLYADATTTTAADTYCLLYGQRRVFVKRDAVFLRHQQRSLQERTNVSDGVS